MIFILIDFNVYNFINMLTDFDENILKTRILIKDFNIIHDELSDKTKKLEIIANDIKMFSVELWEDVKMLYHKLRIIMSTCNRIKKNTLKAMPKNSGDISISVIKYDDTIKDIDDMFEKFIIIRDYHNYISKNKIVKYKRYYNIPIGIDCAEDINKLIDIHYATRKINIELSELNMNKTSMTQKINLMNHNKLIQS